MTDSRFPTLAACITEMPSRQRYIAALAFSESTQPLLHALAIELMRTNLAEERDLAQHEADLEQAQAEALSLAAAAELDRIAELGMHGTTEDDAMRLELVVADATAAAQRCETAEDRAIQLTERLRNFPNGNDAA